MGLMREEIDCAPKELSMKGSRHVDRGEPMELYTAGAQSRGLGHERLDQEEFTDLETGFNILVKSQEMVQMCC